jgi:hypothetical protein
MFGIFRKLGEAREVDADVQVQRQRAARACLVSMRTASRLADTLDPERASLPQTLDDAMNELGRLIDALRSRAGETPIERGLLPYRFGRSG